MVAQITGVRVRETVPDAMLERADELELVDLLARGAARAARRRQGLRARAGSARASTTSSSAATCSRCASSRCGAPPSGSSADVQRVPPRAADRRGVADRTSGSSSASGRARDPSAWSAPRARIAEGMHAPWHAVHVDGHRRAAAVGRRIAIASRRTSRSPSRSAARSRGSRARSVAAALLEFAREHDVTRIVAGKPTHGRWRDRLRGSLLDALIRGSGDIEIHVIAPSEAHARRARRRSPRARAGGSRCTRPARSRWRARPRSASLAGDRLTLPDDAMLYLFAIMVAALGGRGPGLARRGARRSPPTTSSSSRRGTRSRSPTSRNLMTFAVMFTVGTAMGDAGRAAAPRRGGEPAARAPHRRAARVHRGGRARTDVADVAAAVVAHVEDALAAPTAVLLADARRHARRGRRARAARAAGDRRRALGARPPASGRPRHRDPAAGAPARGAAVGRRRARPASSPCRSSARGGGSISTRRRLLEAIARQAGVAIARLRLTAEAREAELRAQAEELRSSLLVDRVARSAHAARDHHRHRDRAPRRRAAAAAPQLESLDTIVDEAAAARQDPHQPPGDHARTRNIRRSRTP